MRSVGGVWVSVWGVGVCACAVGVCACVLINVVLVFKRKGIHLYFTLVKSNIDSLVMEIKMSMLQKYFLALIRKIPRFCQSSNRISSSKSVEFFSILHPIPSV